MKIFMESEVIHMLASVIGKTDLLGFQNFTQHLSSKDFDVEKYISEKYPKSDDGKKLIHKLIEIGKSKSDLETSMDKVIVSAYSEVTVKNIIDSGLEPSVFGRMIEKQIDQIDYNQNSGYEVDYNLVNAIMGDEVVKPQ